MSWKISSTGYLISDGTPTVAWDLDSSVRSTMQRRHLVPKIKAGEATWDDYSLLCADDVPITGSVALMRLLGNTCANIAVSACSDVALGLTRQWCVKHDVPLDDFLMRPAGDRTESGIFKVSAIRRLQDAGLDVVLCVEDWEPVAEYITQETGVPVLGVNPFDPNAALINQDELSNTLAEEYVEDCWTSPDELAALVFARFRASRNVAKHQAAWAAGAVTTTCL